LAQQTLQIPIFFFFFFFSKIIHINLVKLHVWSMITIRHLWASQVDHHITQSFCHINNLPQRQATGSFNLEDSKKITLWRYRFLRQANPSDVRLFTSLTAAICDPMLVPSSSPAAESDRVALP